MTNGSLYTTEFNLKDCIYNSIGEYCLYENGDIFYNVNKEILMNKIKNLSVFHIYCILVKCKKFWDYSVKKPFASDKYIANLFEISFIESEVLEQVNYIYMEDWSKFFVSSSKEENKNLMSIFDLQEIQYKAHVENIESFLEFLDHLRNYEFIGLKDGIYKLEENDDIVECNNETEEDEETFTFVKYSSWVK